MINVDDPVAVAQVIADRLWLVSLLRTEALEFRVLLHLTGFNNARLAEALDQEWFERPLKRWRLSAEGREQNGLPPREYG